MNVDDKEILDLIISKPHCHYEIRQILQNHKEVMVLSKKSKQKPIIRLLHHFACTGGSIISKALSTMPEVCLFSEIHPLSKNAFKWGSAYTPTDLIAQGYRSGVPNFDKYSSSLFKESIYEAQKHIASYGYKLLMRVHTHTDFCTANFETFEDRVTPLLEEDFEVLEAITVRDPVESFISLVNNNWVHFEPGSFDEYCYRYIRFLENKQHCKVFKYEEFVETPEKITEELCRELDIAFDSKNLAFISDIKVSGNSGRSGDNIKSRKPKYIDDFLRSQINNSQNYNKLLSLLDY